MFARVLSSRAFIGGRVASVASRCAVSASSRMQNRSMSSRPLLMIPGPIEYSDAVRQANAMHGVAHVDPHFINAFGDTLSSLRDVFLAPDGQPVVMAGSGSLGWDMVVANLLEAGDEVLVVNIGYFGDSFVACAEAYGHHCDVVQAPVGHAADLAAIGSALESKKYKMVHITHVDTSTAVRSDVEAIARLVREKQEDALVAVDGVCALAGEELRMTEWDVDAYITGSQKALGVPTGLSLQMLRPRAMQALNKRSTPVASYYLNYNNWLPIMDNYENKKPSYFATPAVSLIYSLQVGVQEVLENGGMEKRFAEHKAASDTFKAAMSAIGVKQLPSNHADAAHTLSALLYPEGVDGPSLLPKVKQHGAIVGGGLHKECKDSYFRVGHMGLSSRTPSHIVQTVAAIESGLADCGHEFEHGAGVKIAESLSV